MIKKNESSANVSLKKLEALATAFDALTAAINYAITEMAGAVVTIDATVAAEAAATRSNSSLT
jgi:hypothetical protein